MKTLIYEPYIPLVISESFSSKNDRYVRDDGTLGKVGDEEWDKIQEDQWKEHERAQKVLDESDLPPGIYFRTK